MTHCITIMAYKRIKMITSCKQFLAALFFLSLLSTSALAGTINVACAANFTAPMKELAALYTKRTGTRVRCTFGSTGGLSSRIAKGAPLDLFFAGDRKRPDLLFEAGKAKRPEVYARGRVVLWSRSNDLREYRNWRDVLNDERVKTIALALPAPAPYGAAARDAMRDAGTYDYIAHKIVSARDVSQAFQSAFSGSADVAFVAFSQSMTDKGMAGPTWYIPEARPLRQAACLLRRHRIEAADFLSFVLQDFEARDIIKKYGYN